MLMPQHFAAPWSLQLKLLTVVFSGLLLYAASQADAVGSAAITGVLMVCAALAVRGYSVVGGQLLVHRLGWASRFDLNLVASADYSPGATLGSVRTFGIGGLFGFVGHFRNAFLGPYRAYATDPANAVVLRLGREVVVVTPERPAEFVAAIEAAQAQSRS